MANQRLQIREIVKGNKEIDGETKKIVLKSLQSTINGEKQDTYLMECSFRKYIECSYIKNNYSYYETLEFPKRETVRVMLHDHKLIKYECNRNITCTSDKCLRQYRGMEWWKCVNGCSCEDVNIFNDCIISDDLYTYKTTISKSKQKDTVYKRNLKKRTGDVAQICDDNREGPLTKKRKLSAVQLSLSEKDLNID
eukprot:180133_1